MGSRLDPTRAGEDSGSHPVAECFDAIVVGSGMGGLTCASLLAQLRGQRVLVLERHYRLGGFTHTFRRPGGRSWDVGLHYVGQMGEGEPTRGLMDLVTGGSVQWNAMPSPFERYVYPGLVVDQPTGREAYTEVLCARWPRERDGIERYFREVESASRWVGAYLLSRGGPSWTRWPASALRRLGRAGALRTTGQVLDACVTSAELKAVLASQWGDYGLPPSRSAFLVHAVIASHYLDGGWYPVGGAATIAEGAQAVIEAAGGACLTSHEVETILLERGRAIGVQARRGKARGGETVEFRAPVIVSDAGARLTFEHLLAEDASPAVQCLRNELRELPHGYGAVQLFLGLRESPRVLGFRGENHWLYDGYDHDALFARRNELLEAEPTIAYLSFPSLKDPGATTHTAEIIAPLDHARVADWMERPWKRRGSDYEAVKERISAALLAFVERRYPGFSGLVDYQELATPLTVQHFAAHPQGAIYGLPAVPERFTIRGLGDHHTPRWSATHRERCGGARDRRSDDGRGRHGGPHPRRGGVPGDHGQGAAPCSQTRRCFRNARRARGPTGTPYRPGPDARAGVSSCERGGGEGLRSRRSWAAHFTREARAQSQTAAESFLASGAPRPARVAPHTGGGPCTRRARSSLPGSRVTR